MKRHITLACWALIACLGLTLSLSTSWQARAQSTADPERLAAAKELMAAMNMPKQFDALMPMMMQSFTKMMLAGKPADAQAKAQEFSQKFMAKASEKKYEMIDDMENAYAEAFTTEELKEITQFYKSSAGVKLLATQPQLMQRGMRFGQQWGMKIGMEVIQEMGR